MKKAILRDLFSEEEISIYLKYDFETDTEFIENFDLKQIQKLAFAIMKLLYPNLITDGSCIISKTYEFLAKRANEKGLTIF